MYTLPFAHLDICLSNLLGNLLSSPSAPRTPNLDYIGVEVIWALKRTRDWILGTFQVKLC